MATFKITIRPHQVRKDGRYPVSIRLTHKSKIAYMPTSYYVGKSDMTKTFELKKPVIARVLNERIEKYETLIVKLDWRIDAYDVHALADYLEKATRMGDRGVDIIEYGKRTVAQMQAEGHEGSALNYRTAIGNLEKFLTAKNMAALYTSDITVKFLQEYERFVSCCGKRAPSMYISALRHLFYSARAEYNDEDRGVILIANNPFAKYRVPKQNVAAKRGLTSEVIQRIRACEPPTAGAKFARDVFMLSFFLAGANAVDLYGCTPPVDGYLIYQRAKTRGRRADKAEIHVRMEGEALQLLDRYRDESGVRAFCFYRRYRSVAGFNGALSRGLKTVGALAGVADLTFYAARHSWAGIARNECGIPKSEVHEYLNHVDADLKVTDLYLQRDWRPLAEANRKVIDRVLQTVLT